MLIQKSRSDGYGWVAYDTVRGAGSTALRIDSNAGSNANVVGPYVNVDQYHCKKPKKVKTQFKSMNECQSIDFRNVGIEGCQNNS